MALATVAIYPLAHVAPVVSLSVVYLPAVLLAATYWGLALGIFAAVLGAAAFNFFHLPPVGKFTIADSRNWVALAAFMIVALVAGTIAELARARGPWRPSAGARRRIWRPSLAARAAAGRGHRARALATTARRVAEALGLPSAAIELGVAPGDERRMALALRDADGRQIATLLVPRELPAATDEQIRSRLVPTLEALVAIARRRDAMQAEAVETAALRRSDDIKTALLRAVSHDLRTPLTSVVAAGHALGTGTLTDDERRELSAAVVEEGTRLAGMVDNLLALSRLQAGAADPRSDWVSIEDLVTAAGEGLSGEPAETRLTIDAGVPEIRADAAQLERAFANLLENARRYSGGLPVSVHARRSGPHVLVSVVDQGPGIDSAERERIFEPFYRGRTRSDEAWTGSGLGLAIAKGVVEANGGTIEVQSLPGQGTSFVVELPIAERPAGRSQHVSTGKRTSRPRVLICDDEQQILRALRVILRDAGYESLPASTGEEALDIAAVSRPDAGIIDLVLPDGDGVELCRRLREWTEMPLIVLSAVGDEDAKVRALAAGADDYVTKPFGPRELVARLQANMRRVEPDPQESLITSGGLEVDLAAHTVRLDGDEVHLTPTEFGLLAQLARNRGRLMTHHDLLVAVWGNGYAEDTQVLRAHIANLRRKIEPPGAPKYIRTDPGVGYRFAA